MVINVENNLNGISLTPVEENKDDSSKKSDIAELIEIQENTLNLDDDKTKSQLHKCSISTLLNIESETISTDPIFCIDFKETDISISNNFKDASE